MTTTDTRGSRVLYARVQIGEHAAVQAAARADGITPSMLVWRAVQSYLDQRALEQPQRAAVECDSLPGAADAVAALAELEEVA